MHLLMYNIFNVQNLNVFIIKIDNDEQYTDDVKVQNKNKTHTIMRQEVRYLGNIIVLGRVQ